MPLQQIPLLAIASGLVTWKILNRKDVRGDYAAVILLTSLSLYYTYAFKLNRMSLEVVTAPALWVLSTAIATICYRLSPWHPLASYPGPVAWKISSLCLTYISSKGRRHLILDEMHAKYGPFLRIGPNTLSINRLAATQIYSAAAHMEKSEAYRVPGRRSAVALWFKQPTEKLHSDRKKVWWGFFTGSGATQLLPVLEQRTWELLHCIERRQKEHKDNIVDVRECCAHWSYDFMGDMVFGGANRLELMKNGDPNQLIMGGKKATVVLDSVGQSPWLMDLVMRMPTGKRILFLRQLSISMLHTRLQTTGLPPYRDLVSYWQEDGTIPTGDMELDSVVAIQGGSDNTSTAIGLAIFFLCTRPECFSMLREELDKAFPNPVGPLPASELILLPYLEAVINETLRLSSPYFIPRLVPSGGATIDGKFIPEGTVVALAAYSQQTSPDNYYPAPMNYHPERWFPNGMGPDTHTTKTALFSFSSGPHACIAKVFAYQEMRHVIARMVLTMDFTFADGFDPKAFRNGLLNMRTTVLEKPLMMKVKRRDGIDFNGVDF